MSLTLSARTEGREADRPIRPRAPGKRAEPGAAPVRVRLGPPWRVGFNLVAAGLLLVAGGVLHAWVAPSPPASQPPHVPTASASAGQSDTTGVGESALSEPPRAPEPPSLQERIRAPVPAEPLPGQRLPPCKKPQVEINGGCWVLVGNELPPCIENTYEWRKQCYMPFFGPPRPSTSGEK